MTEPTPSHTETIFDDQANAAEASSEKLPGTMPPRYQMESDPAEGDPAIALGADTPSKEVSADREIDVVDAVAPSFSETLLGNATTHLVLIPFLHDPGHTVFVGPAGSGMTIIAASDDHAAAEDGRHQDTVSRAGRPGWRNPSIEG